MLKSNLRTATAVALTLSFGTMASIAAAQEPGKQTGQPETGMMGGQSGMMGNRGGGMMGDPAQMKRMVENCNRMMESMMQTMPSTPEKKR